MSDLTHKQARFVAEYLIDLNATQAAIRAGYSQKTASQQGARLLRNVKVREAVAQGERRQLKAADVEKDRIIQELKAIAFAKPILGMCGQDGKILPAEQWPEDIHAAIRSFEVVVRSAPARGGYPDTVVKVSFCNKVAALELLGKHFGVAQQHGEMTTHEEIALLLDQGRERLLKRGLLKRTSTTKTRPPEAD